MKRKLKVVLSLAMVLVLSMVFNASIFACGNDHDFSGKVDIGGYSLYTEVKGEGNPVVVFEMGYGDAHDLPIQFTPDSPLKIGIEEIRDAVVNDATTVAYDRAGLGQSDASTLYRSWANKATELHNLLVKLKKNKHIVYVSHSQGNVGAVVYASMFPGEIDGVVMIDGVHPGQIPYLQDLYINMMGQEFWDTVIKPSFICPDGNYDTIMLAEQEFVTARQSDPLRNIPLTVISANNHGLGDDFENLWASWQQDLASMSNDSKVVSADSEHYVYYYQPQLVIDEVKAMINKVSKNCHGGHCN